MFNCCGPILKAFHPWKTGNAFRGELGIRHKIIRIVSMPRDHSHFGHFLTEGQFKLLQGESKWAVWWGAASANLQHLLLVSVIKSDHSFSQNNKQNRFNKPPKKKRRKRKQKKRRGEKYRRVACCGTFAVFYINKVQKKCAKKEFLLNILILSVQLKAKLLCIPPGLPVCISIALCSPNILSSESHHSKNTWKSQEPENCVALLNV